MARRPRATRRRGGVRRPVHRRLAPAPWMMPEDGAPASLITTGLIAGTLHARGLQHSWLDGATGLLWPRIGSLTGTGPYDVRAVLRFLDSVPDRDRAHAAAARLGPVIFGEGLVAL